MSAPVPGFDLLAELGRGGMGVVYRAREQATDRLVALKLLLSNDPQRRERFRREALAAEALEHPGIVRVLRSGDLPQGGAWIAFELVEGARPLDAAFKDRVLTERVELVRDVAAAVGHAHERGVVHRDLKPANILVDGAGCPRVADFGIAQIEGHERLTQTGTAMGTPQFAAPELLSGRTAEVGPPTDVWSLGVLLYLALTAELPFRASTLVELVTKLESSSPTRPSRLVEQVPRALERVTLKAIARRPADRYPDAGALAAALDAALSGRGGRRVGLGVAGAALLLGGLGAAVWATRPAPVPAPASPPPAAPVTAPVPAPSASGEPKAAGFRRRAEHFERAGWPERAVEFYRKAAEAEDRLAMRRLGEHLRDGRGVKRDLGAARRWLRRAYDAGDLRAGALLGILVGSSLPENVRDVLSGVRTLTRVAEQGDTLAMRALSYAFQVGLGPQVSPAKARTWLQRAVAAGDGFAAATLAELHDAAKEPGPALEAYRAAAKLGNPKGARRLRERAAGAPPLLDGPALAWLRAAIRKGDPEAMLDLGRAYAQGDYGLSPSRTDAVRWFERAAWAGSGEGMAELGRSYRRGLGVAISRKLAEGWLFAARGMRRRHATVDLALLLVDKRKPTFADQRRASLLLREAAAVIPRAKRELAFLLLKSEGAQELKEGLDWLRRAADDEDGPALERLAVAHAFGRYGLKQDEARGWKVLRRAAAAGGSSPLKRIGEWTRSGRGVPSDVEAARGWFRKAEAAATRELAERETAELRTRRGRVRWRLLDLNGALADFLRAVELRPSASAWGRVAEVQMVLGRLRESLATCQRAFARDPQNGYTMYVEVEALMLQGQLDRALTRADRMVKLRPRWGASYLARARLRVARREWRELLADCAEGLKRSPGHAMFLAMRGLAKLETGDATGLVDCDAGVAANPAEPEVYRFRAEARLAAGDRPGAKADLTRITKLEAPTHPQTVAARERLAAWGK